MGENMKRIVICKYCGRPEFWGNMRYDFVYAWDDLDGPRPTREEYDAQEAGR